MESHVLKRQSNNKRSGRRAGPLATMQCRRPLCRYTVSDKYHAKPNTHNCENMIVVATVSHRRGKFDVPCWRRAANFSQARLTLCPKHSQQLQITADSKLFSQHANTWLRHLLNCHCISHPCNTTDRDQHCMDRFRYASWPTTQAHILLS